MYGKQHDRVYTSQIACIMLYIYEYILGFKSKFWFGFKVKKIIFMNIYWVLSQNVGFKSKHNIYEHILGFKSKFWLSQNVIFMNIYWVLGKNLGLKSKHNIYEHM